MDADLAGEHEPIRHAEPPQGRYHVGCWTVLPPPLLPEHRCTANGQATHTSLDYDWFFARSIRLSSRIRNCRSDESSVRHRLGARSKTLPRTASLVQAACEPCVRLGPDFRTNIQREGLLVVGNRLRFPPVVVMEKSKVVVRSSLRALCRHPSSAATSEQLRRFRGCSCMVGDPPSPSAWPVLERGTLPGAIPRRC